MKNSSNRNGEKMKYIKELIERYPVLECVQNEIENACRVIIDAYERGGKLLIAGNGGSAADADHISGELLKGFIKKRPVEGKLKQDLTEMDEEGILLAQKLQMGLPAIALPDHSGLNSAVINDMDGKYIYAQQVLALGKEDDVFWGISTSGNSQNIRYAVKVSKAKKMKTIFLGGKDGGLLKGLSDVDIIVPEYETYRIQELHLPVYHAVCMEVEDHFFSL